MKKHKDCALPCQKSGDDPSRSSLLRRDPRVRGVAHETKCSWQETLATTTDRSRKSLLLLTPHVSRVSYGSHLTRMPQRRIVRTLPGISPELHLLRKEAFHAVLSIPSELFTGSHGAIDR